MPVAADGHGETLDRRSSSSYGVKPDSFMKSGFEVVMETTNDTISAA